ncbi:hypothetical protein UA3_01114 [Enterococcus faecium EnGen0263]|uniref:hypothetical protein n=1 Tax=Enterococcus faecium TaxID=1352 RepID=UPI0003311549|nr:hypothetical protein [Enterococcus faecium]EOH55931.1 hypothetical protein UA3_01114 [Enterococcus faecium EnGen0263]
MNKKTVKDLIEILSKLEQDKEIVFFTAAESPCVYPFKLDEISIDYDENKDRYQVCI